MYVVQSKNLEKTVFILHAQVRVLQTPAWVMLQVFCNTKKKTKSVAIRIKHVLFMKNLY